MAFGGAYATADDLFRFVRALESGKLIAKTTLANATTTHQEHYGYGFNLQGDGKLRYYGMRAAHQAEMARFVYTSSDTS